MYDRQREALLGNSSEGPFGVNSPSSVTNDLKGSVPHGWMETERICLTMSIHVSLSLCKGVRPIQLVNVPFHLLEH